MTHAQPYDFQASFLAIIAGYLHNALSMMSKRWIFTPTLNAEPAAFLTDCAVAKSIELMALETLAAQPLPAPVKYKPKPRPETVIERRVLNCWETPHHIKITPYVCLCDESKDGLLMRFYNAESELIDVVTVSEPGEICVYGEAA